MDWSTARAVALGLLTGVHLALASTLLAIPRACPTCIVVCALAVVALASGSRGASTKPALWALVGSMGGVHALVSFAA